MRLTVGPLPSAVYWRRRALVLGVLLLILGVLYASCSPDSGAGSKNTAGTPTPTPTVTEEESESAVLTPETGTPPGGSGENPGDDPSASGSGPTDAVPPPQAPVDTSPCTDDEITLTPVPAKTRLATRTPVDLRLIITNSSDRSCARDVGADWQELRIVRGAETIWSSDRCGAAKGSDVQMLRPDAKREYMITWNGQSSSKCSAGAPAGGAPPAGQYQLIGRLGMKHSTPVTLTLAG